MGRRRSILLGSVLSAASLLLGPRLGSFGRGLSRKSGARRCRGGSLAAFAGTPCSAPPTIESAAPEVAAAEVAAAEVAAPDLTATGDERGEDSTAGR
jgi:hypothetical protein